MSEVKQVIVIRKDLKMRRGKEIAQGSHASLAWLSKRINYFAVANPDAIQDYEGFTEAEKIWLTGPFAKICLQVNSEQELIDIHEAALKAGLESHLIIDAGKTEFDGIPTATCCGIGPDWSDKINQITGKLSLY